jgi:hypothetical protein
LKTLKIEKRFPLEVVVEVDVGRADDATALLPDVMYVCASEEA